METPLWNFNEFSEGVYEPREDSFLLLDALEADVKLIKEKRPAIALEIGSGSGVIISAIAKLLSQQTVCIGLDINPAACRITSETANLNNLSVEILRTDLVNGLKLNGLIDLLLFNPPYVPSTEEEVTIPLDMAWAGHDGGTSLLKRLFVDLNELMSPRCLGYIVVIEENNPQEIIDIISSLGFHCEIVANRKVIGGEKLSIVRFLRGDMTSSIS